MSNLPVPKIMTWEPTFDQVYKSKHQKLLVSGGCYAGGTNQLDCAASWPGYVKDLCRYESVIDLSYPSIGNEYVADSIIHYLDSLGNKKQEFLVIVMWTVIAWVEVKTPNSTKQPLVGTTNYSRLRPKPTSEDFITSCHTTFNKIFELKSYLEKHNVDYVFTYFANKLYPNQTTVEKLSCSFNDHLPDDLIDQLKSINWVPSTPADYFFDFAVRNGCMDSDVHPSIDAHLKWAQEILLPELCRNNLIFKI